MAKRIRVVLCSYPGVYQAIVATALGQAAAIELVGLVESTRIFTRPEPRWLGALRLLATCGLRYGLLQWLQTDLYRLAGAVLPKQGRPAAPPVCKTQDINGARAGEFLRALAPDVLLLANFNQKLAEAVIALPHLACLNLHPGLLPARRGPDPVFAALAGGDGELGVSLHRVTPVLDGGDVLAQAVIKATANASLFHHQCQLFTLGAQLAVAAIERLPAGLPGQAQTGPGHYDPWPGRRQVGAFAERGGSLVRAGEWLAQLRASHGRSANRPPAG